MARRNSVMRLSIYSRAIQSEWDDVQIPDVAHPVIEWQYRNRRCGGEFYSPKVI
jgi:hypothetical protein